jgi:hypothetical protein
MNDTDIAAAKAYVAENNGPDEHKIDLAIQSYLAGLAAGRVQDRRERVAIAMMAAIAPECGGEDWEKRCSKQAIAGADFLLAELDRTAAKLE